MRKILLIALLFNIKYVNAQLCFNTATNFPADSSAGCVTSADFNGDGKLDIAVANYYANNVSVLIGNGTGSFAPATVFTVGTNPSYLTSADFNGDNNIDLAVANWGSQNISILIGTGTGSFGTPTNYTVGCGPYSLINSDFNNDGKVDLATANYYCGSGTIFLGAGNGTFSVDTIIYNIGVDPCAMASADFDGDGNKDLAYACSNYNQNLSIFYGTGTGSFFYNEVESLNGGSPTSITTNYFNGDTLIDLAVSFNAGNSVSVVLNTVMGYTAEIHIGGNGSSGCDFSSIISEDFNGDCKNDLGMTGGCLDVVSIFLGAGTGTFAPDTNISLGIGYYKPYNIISADLNGDGKKDIVTANQNSGDVSVLLNCNPVSILSVSDSLYKDTIPFTWDILPQYSSNVINAKWYWGDSTSSSALYPSHTYTTAGWYNICVTVYNSCGDSAKFCQNDSIYQKASNSSMIYVNVIHHTTGVNQITNNINQITFYPNPTSDQFYIETNSTVKLNVDLYDVNGRLVFSKSVSDKENINVTSLDNGTYTLTIKTADRVINKKLVILR